MLIIKSVLSVLVLVGSLMVAAAKTGPAHDKVVVCYVSTWAVYRPNRGSYSLDHLDPNLCTHIIYAFSGLDAANDAIKSLDPWQDLKEDYGKAGFDRITNLKKIYPHLKVSLAIGGWNEGSANYSMLTADPDRRKRFVKNASEFVRKYNFDGLDLDWEYPALRGGEPMDKENFVQLVKELKTDFKKYNLLLTSAIGAAKNTIDQAYSVKLLSRYLDYMHIMSYDYGGTWDKKITANAPLHSDDALNVEFTIDYLLRLGASPDKIVLGIPFYGRTFITELEGNFGDASNDIGFMGPYTRENGFMGYNEVCDILSNRTSQWTKSYDTNTQQGIAKFRDEASGQTKVVVYDSARSVAVKARFAMRKELAGAMIWSVDTDDFLGECDTEHDTYDDFGETAGVKLTIPRRVNANYPLLRTINEAIIISLNEMRQEAEIKESEIENEIPIGDEDHTNTGGSQRIVAGVMCCAMLLLRLVL